MPSLNPNAFEGGRRRSRGLKTKTLRRMLKKKGMKTTGKKATLMKRLHMRGGATKGTDGKWTITGSDTKYDTEEEADAAAAQMATKNLQEEGAIGMAGEPAAAPAAATAVEEEGGRRRRRSRRRREEGGRRHRRSRRGKEMLGY
jgi:hypothetical protein